MASFRGLLDRLRGRAPVPIVLAPPAPRPPADLAACLADLVAAYPDHLAGFDDMHLFWREGPPTPLRRRPGERPVEAMLAEPDIADLFAWDYPLGAAGADNPPGDPGRPRPAALFGRIYGDCHRGEVQAQLVKVAWAGRIVRFTAAAGAAQALGRVAADLEALGPGFAGWLWPLSGTFKCRPIAGTRTASMHAYGAAIDLASRHGDYWRWGPRRRPAVPAEVVGAFERHGFIWGGKWAHFDTFHFEYRPEIIAAARRPASPPDN